jgi:serine/threonine protein kinase
VVDADADGPVPWLAMEYVSGEPLERAVTRDGPFPPGRLRVLAAQLAEGLCAIHAAGLVHRDLKPGNVLLAADGPRIIDFGVSRTLGVDGGTQAGDIVGTPGFLSPEQAEGGEASAASDVFSLGAVLAFAGTGRRPFGLGDLTSRVYRVLHAAPDLDGIPEGEVRELIERCLAKDPAARPAPADILTELGAEPGSAPADAGESSRLPVVQPAPIEPAPVAEVAAGQRADTDTYLGDEGIPAAARPIPAPPGIPAIVTVNVNASGNARVIVAGGDVHVNE